MANRTVEILEPSPTPTLDTKSLSNEGLDVAAPTLPANGADGSDGRSSLAASDEAILARLGYKQEFVREFTNLSVRPVVP